MVKYHCTDVDISRSTRIFQSWSKHLKSLLNNIGISLTLITVSNCCRFNRLQPLVFLVDRISAMDTNTFLFVICLLAMSGSINCQNLTDPNMIYLKDHNSSTISIKVKLLTSTQSPIVSPPTTIAASNASSVVTTSSPNNPALGDKRPPKVLPCEMNTVTATTNGTNNIALVQCYDHNDRLVTIGVTTLNLTQTNVQSTQVKTAELDMKSLAIIVVGYVAFLCVIAIVGVVGVLVVACQQGVHRRSRCSAGYQTIV